MTSQVCAATVPICGLVILVCTLTVPFWHCRRAGLRCRRAHPHRRGFCRETPKIGAHLSKIPAGILKVFTRIPIFPGEVPKVCVLPSEVGEECRKFVRFFRSFAGKLRKFARSRRKFVGRFRKFPHFLRRFPKNAGSLPAPDESLPAPDDSLPVPDESLRAPDESLSVPDESFPISGDALRAYCGDRGDAVVIKRRRTDDYSFQQDKSHLQGRANDGVAPAGLCSWIIWNLGRCPRLAWFAPLALGGCALFGDFRYFPGDLRYFPRDLRYFFGYLRSFRGNLRSFQGNLRSFWSNLRSFRGEHRAKRPWIRAIGFSPRRHEGHEEAPDLECSPMGSFLRALCVFVVPMRRSRRDGVTHGEAGGAARESYATLSSKAASVRP